MTLPALLGEPEPGADVLRRLLAAGVPLEALEKLLGILSDVDHPGTTAVEIHHGPDGSITQVDLTPAQCRVRVRA